MSHLVGQLLTLIHDARSHEHKNCTKSHLVGQLLTLIHDARTHEHNQRSTVTASQEGREI
jgi:hypothetical protein